MTSSRSQAALLDIQIQHHMVVVARHRVGGDADGEDLLQQFHPFQEPGFAVVEVFAVVVVLAAEQGARSVVW